MLLRSEDTSETVSAVRLLGGAVVLVSWPSPLADGERATATVDGTLVGKMQVSVQAPMAAGGVRSFLAFRLPRDRSTPGGTLAVRSSGGAMLAEATLAGTPEPLDTRVLDTLAPAGRFRLVRFVLDLCTRTFKLHGDPGFVALCRALVASVAPEPAMLGFRYRLTGTATLYEALLPGELGAIASTVVLAPDRIGIVTPVPEARRREAVRPGVRTHDVVLTRDVAVDGADRVVFFGASGLAVREIETMPVSGGPDFVQAMERRRIDPEARSFALRALAQRRESDADAAAILHDATIAAVQPPTRAVDPAKPVGVALEVAVHAEGAGLFVAGWIRDPLGLVQSCRIGSVLGESVVPVTALRRFRRPDIARRYAKSAFTEAGDAFGFVGLLPDVAPPASPAQFALTLPLTAGAAVRSVAPPQPLDPARARDAVLESVPAAVLSPDMLAECLGPAAASLHAAARARRGQPSVIDIGRPPADAAVSVIVPLYRNLGFLRFQFAAFAVDAAMRDAELVFVLDSPEQRIDVEHLLRGFHALYDLPMRLVVMAENAGYAAANNAAARHARGRNLLLLNSDVVPVAEGWLPSLVAALEADATVGAVGAKLLFEDGSIQHAGLRFSQDFEGGWYNSHFFKGYPRHFEPANRRRAVPGVTGACLLLSRALYETLGGIAEDYIVGDYEDSDLCLRIRAEGRTIVYEPAAELYHFERRSIALHEGYAETAAAAYNRRLHAERWAEAMAALMAREDWTETVRGSVPATAAA